MPKINLREGGIYALTDKREFVARKPTFGVGFLLYDKDAWQRTNMAEYRVHEDGRLSRHGRVTRWRVNHLVDTGRNIDGARGAR